MKRRQSNFSFYLVIAIFLAAIGWGIYAWSECYSGAREAGFSVVGSLTACDTG